ncbi:MAG TPA: hypothetical protein VEB66_04270 [Opitutaceae bacterium]|nr:hypothetical protein [Opitutaceae bacterium]
MVPANQANQLQTTETGTVVKVRDVTVEGRRTHLGQYGGAVVGGAVAVPTGGVRNAGDAVGVAVASTAGAIVGDAAEEYLTRKEAQEITIQLKDGTMVTVVQADPAKFQPGDEVHVIHSPAGARVAMAMGL